MLLNYETRNNEQVTVKVGLSYTSIENAKKNLLAEASGYSFDKVRRQTEDKWREHLGRILVEGGSEESRTKFYTGLYHCLLGRGLAASDGG